MTLDSPLSEAQAAAFQANVAALLDQYGVYNPVDRLVVLGRALLGDAARNRVGMAEVTRIALALLRDR